MLDSHQKQQRVQVVVRGQRFESTAEILSAYCLLFRCFFREAFAKARGSGDVGSSSDGIDWQLWYDTAVSEVSVSLPHDTGKRMMVAPASVGWDEKSSIWKFVYTDTKLSPGDVGVVFVHIRKLFLWSSSQKQRQEQVQPKGQPQLPIRWHEMSHDLQVAMARVVCTFGVMPLIGQYDRPTSPLSGDMNPDDTAAAITISPWEKAKSYLQHRMMRVQSGDAVQEDAACSVVHPSVEDDDLLLVATACSRCGVTGHTDANCMR